MDSRTHLAGDWYPLGLPRNIILGSDVYLDSSYGFAGFHSLMTPGLTIGKASGVYDRAALIVGPRGSVSVGEFTVLNGTYLICNDRIDIGAHCLLSWGVVITDNWSGGWMSIESRRAAMLASAESPVRHPPSTAIPRPVVLEDNVWVGFGAVILPGVRLGRGCIVGCRSMVYEDVPPYAVVAGDPARIIRGNLEPDDTVEAREAALADLVGVTG
ncbi:MAG: acyltransferase [Gemmatimonadaceae bacterium]|nr:acyltransferase [Gemmatimonadaceae bacterium]